MSEEKTGLAIEAYDMCDSCPYMKIEVETETISDFFGEVRNINSIKCIHENACNRAYHWCDEEDE